ncbi:Transposase, Rhodopirellula-type, partial [mine drainage metagenome]
MPQGKPEKVRVHDFLIPENGKAIPYGVYDLHRNGGVGQCRGRPRHGELRRADDPAMVAADGSGPV